MGRCLNLFAETSVSSRLGALCTVPSPGVDQSQSQRMVGPLKGGPREGSQQVDRIRRRQG